jgi:lipopolysaccharide export system protein LptA
MIFSFLPHFPLRRLSLAWIIPVTLTSAITFATLSPSAIGQTPSTGQTGSDNRALTINSDTQEADSKTGVYTARGNVQIFYPARQIQATSAQAQYFQREGRIVLTGDVYVLQQGNSIKGEKVTYLIKEGRFIVTPQANKQVESIYIVNESNPQTQTQAAPETPALNPKPAPKPPASKSAAPK